MSMRLSELIAQLQCIQYSLSRSNNKNPEVRIADSESGRTQEIEKLEMIPYGELYIWLES